jgi:mannosyl-oligosaccharide glucosidase
MFSKAITANLLGGVGYFYGPSIIQRKSSYEWDDDADGIADEEEGPRLTESRGLLTATPSRSFFPRGFYWYQHSKSHQSLSWRFDIGTKDFIYCTLANGITISGILVVSSVVNSDSLLMDRLEILQSWIDLIDEDGWVGREQILGEEARSKVEWFPHSHCILAQLSQVPAEFQTQVPQYANPPTLTMAVTAFIERIKSAQSDRDLNVNIGIGGSQFPLFAPNHTAPPAIAYTGVGNRYLESPELARVYLKSIYGPLKSHYDWFRRTQRGQIKQYSRVARSRTEAYRWRGRSPTHVLTSGMDDYPRGSPHVGELHLDLICWMAFFTRTMKEISGFIGQKEDEASFGEIESAILHNIEGTIKVRFTWTLTNAIPTDLHWSETQQMYCDADVDDEGM